MRLGRVDVPRVTQWLTKNLQSGSKVGIDAYRHSTNFVKSLKKDLQNYNISVISIGKFYSFFFLHVLTIIFKK